MARYRHKTKEDLAWNSIRRTLTRTFDMAIADAREEALNDMLQAAWTDYTAALKKGEVREIESKYKRLAGEIVKDMVKPLEVGPGADLADD